MEKKPDVSLEEEICGYCRISVDEEIILLLRIRKAL